MYRIITKKNLNPTVTQMEIEAPLVANKALPGQFIILRVDEAGERIPLTVAGVDKARGAVKIIFQIVGATTSCSTIRTRANPSRISWDPWAFRRTLRGSRRSASWAAAWAARSQCRWRRRSTSRAPRSLRSSGSETRTC